MQEANAHLPRLAFASAAIVAALIAASLSGSPHRYPRPNEKLHFDAPVYVTTIYSVHTARCSFDRESAEDLATYGALDEPEALLPMCVNPEPAAVRYEERSYEPTGILALAR